MNYSFTASPHKMNQINGLYATVNGLFNLFNAEQVIVSNTNAIELSSWQMKINTTSKRKMDCRNGEHMLLYTDNSKYCSTKLYKLLG